jgi:hypothetical protein
MKYLRLHTHSDGGDLNWSGIVNATILLAGGVVKMAVGGVAESFSIETLTFNSAINSGWSRL